MATTKTLTPTNQTITLAAFTEKPDNRINVTNDDRLADAVNALNSNYSQYGNIVELLGNTTGTGEKTLSDSYSNYRYVLMLAFSGSTIYPALYVAGGLLGAGYTLSVYFGASNYASVRFVNGTTVNVVNNPTSLRIYGIK